MAAAGATGGDQRFRVWIRRRNDPQGPYAIRFEVSEGKGILRVARPGVLVDPPARPSGAEERLTASQVRASRFLHVWDGGRYRQGHLLARLDEARLENMPADRWIELAHASEGTTALLVLPAEIGPDSGIVDDEPTWPRRELLAGLQREVRGLGDRPPPDDEFATEVRSIPAEARRLDLDARIPEPRTPSDDRTDARTVGDIHGSRAESERPRARTVAPSPRPASPRSEAPRSEPLREPVRAEPPRELARAEPPRAATPRPAAGPSFEDWLDSHTVDQGPGDEDRTVLVSASTLRARAAGVARLPDVGAPRPVLPGLPVLPLVDGDDDDTSIEAFDAIEAIEAVESTGDSPSFTGAIEAMEAPGVDDDAIEALDGGEPSGPFEALEAHGDDEVEVVDEQAPSRRDARTRAQLVEAVTVMPLGAQELAENVSGRATKGAAPRAAPVERDPGPVVGAHARNTTLVRHLRRLLTDERVDNALLRQRIAQLEVERAQLEASRARLEAELRRRT